MRRLWPSFERHVRSFKLTKSGHVSKHVLNPIVGTP